MPLTVFGPALPSFSLLSRAAASPLSNLLDMRRPLPGFDSQITNGEAYVYGSFRVQGQCVLARFVLRPRFLAVHQQKDADRD